MLSEHFACNLNPNHKPVVLKYCTYGKLASGLSLSTEEALKKKYCKQLFKYLRQNVD